MKIYENYFAQLSSTTRFDNGMRLNIKGWYEDRIPIANTTNYSIVTIRGDRSRPITRWSNWIPRSRGIRRC